VTNEVTARCSECDDELWPQTDKERVCDKYAAANRVRDDKFTPDPEYCDMSDTSCEMCEVVDCHRASEV